MLGGREASGAAAGTRKEGMQQVARAQSCRQRGARNRAEREKVLFRRERKNRAWGIAGLATKGTVRDKAEVEQEKKES